MRASEREREREIMGAMENPSQSGREIREVAKPNLKNPTSSVGQF